MVALPPKILQPRRISGSGRISRIRSEYYRGEIFAISGGLVNHNRIARNLLVALDTALSGKPCEAFVNDMRLLVKKNGLYTYPDVMVVCGQLQFVKGRTDTLTNPAVIIEILSESTQGYDRGAKFELYRAIETLQDYLLIDQSRVHVEVFHKQVDDRWLLTELNDLEAVLGLEAIDVEVPLRQVYQRVEWEI